jgi:hypothetical protein
MKHFEVSPNLDDLLLYLATTMELSDNDRRVAARRYVRLKEHLERPASPLRPYLLNGASRIYPQGSMSIGATIIKGVDGEDRFDLDALVEFRVPAHWSPKVVLDVLEESLQGFPDVRRIIRCTRCIQLQFAFMHIDVTILDPHAEPRIERSGEIFHSPDRGAASRVPSNPYGFSQWVRSEVARRAFLNPDFATRIQDHRSLAHIDRLGQVLAEADQDDLPDTIPPRIDSQEIVALKILKRFVNLRYANRTIKRPPPIYLTKKAVDCGFEAFGLCAQLERTASAIALAMEQAIAINSGPDEVNPSFPPDRINDRWPVGQEDRRTLLGDMKYLLARLEEARRSTVPDIVSIFNDLFGAELTRRAAGALLEAATEGAGKTSQRYLRGSGTILAATTPATPAVARSSSPVRDHSFHSGTLNGSTKRH